jgi:hypothetical protein
VNESLDFIDMSDLEETFPYSILRTTNVTLTEQQTEGGKAYAAVTLEDEKEEES